MRAAVRIRDGLPWVATNTDLTLPTATGRRPGNGVLVRLISEFAERGAGGGRQAGSARCSTRRVRRVGGERPLMVGDRLDTDIEGAAAPSWTRCW